MIRSRLGALGNFAMFTVILTLIAVAIGFGILFWTGTLWAQGYFYDSPTSGLSWRAPAAAAVLTLFLTIWCTIEYYAPNSTGAIDDFSIEEITSVKKFWSVRPLNAGEEKDKPIAAIENLYDKEKEKPIPYDRRPTSTPNQYEFVDELGGRWANSKSGAMIAIIVEEKTGDAVKFTRFNAEMKDGNFAPQQRRGVEQSLRYLEQNGSRYMVVERIGRIHSFHRGKLLGNIFINLIHFALWFAVLWPLLRFQWPHALGFGFVGWIAVSLVLVPFLLDKSRTAGEKKAMKPAAVLIKPLSAWHA